MGEIESSGRWGVSRDTGEMYKKVATMRLKQGSPCRDLWTPVEKNFFLLNLRIWNRHPIIVLIDEWRRHVSPPATRESHGLCFLLIRQKSTVLSVLTPRSQRYGRQSKSFFFSWDPCAMMLKNSMERKQLHSSVLATWSCFWMYPMSDHLLFWLRNLGESTVKLLLEVTLSMAPVRWCPTSTLTRSVQKHSFYDGPGDMVVDGDDRRLPLLTWRKPGCWIQNLDFDCAGDWICDRPLCCVWELGMNCIWIILCFVS